VLNKKRSGEKRKMSSQGRPRKKQKEEEKRGGRKGDDGHSVNRRRHCRSGSRKKFLQGAGRGGRRELTGDLEN